MSSPLYLILLLPKLSSALHAVFTCGYGTRTPNKIAYIYAHTLLAQIAPGAIFFLRDKGRACHVAI